jgi:hypothetical protein
MNKGLYLSIENIRLYMSFNEIIQRPFYTVQHILEFSRLALPWIPEPSTVNNILKRREGSGIQGRL